jgi:hypothetical protein
MKMMRSILAVVFALSMAAVAGGQAAKPTVGQYFVSKAKAGSVQQFEAGRKKHMAFHKKANDTFSWITWQIMSGPELGSYMIGTGGHAWKDFDGREKFQAEDDADVAANVGPFTESTRSAYWVYRPDMSISEEGPDHSKFLAVLEFTVKPDGVPAFTEGVMKINEGLKKTNNVTNKSRWYVLASGDEGPRFALVQERNSWSDFEGGPKPLPQMMEEAFGKDAAAELMKKVSSSYWHYKSYILQYRADMSYIPGK